MQLTKKAEYALRAMCDLAEHSDSQPIMSKDIATRQDIPLKFLNQIVPALRGSDLIYAVRGNGGGIYLSRRPDEVNMREIIEAIEGPVALNACLIGEKGCDRKLHCPIHGTWRLAQSQMLAVLESTTLEKLIRQKPVRTKSTPQRLINEMEIED